MDPFVAAHVHTILEDIRLLKSFVTAPLGLHSDIRMLRQSIPLDEAADLSQEENQRRRLAYRALTDDPSTVALHTLEHLNNSLAILQSTNDRGSWLNADWMARASRVLDRAEERVGGDLRAKTASSHEGLYVIVAPDATGGWPVSEVAEAALKGGARAIQFRDYTRDKGDVLLVVQRLKSMCDDHKALLIIDGDPGITLSSEAHGLHLEQADMPVREARRIVQHSQLVGKSNVNIDEVAESQASGVDYLSIGPIYRTAASAERPPAVGVEMVSAAKATAFQSVVAFGGIDLHNAGEVVRAGADSVCVASPLTLADDPEQAARSFVQAIEEAGSKEEDNAR